MVLPISVRAELGHTTHLVAGTAYHDHLALIPRLPLQVEVALSEALLNWPYFHDLSLVGGRTSPAAPLLLRGASWPSACATANMLHCQCFAPLLRPNRRSGACPTSSPRPAARSGRPTSATT